MYNAQIDSEQEDKVIVDKRMTGSVSRPLLSYLSMQFKI
jgi:hypothetical protein